MFHRLYLSTLYWLKTCALQLCNSLVQNICSATVLQVMNMQICSCSAILATTNCLYFPKSPELFQPISLKYGHRSRDWVLNTKSAGLASKGRLLCPLPRCGVEITVGMCTESDLKLQGLHPPSAIWSLQAAGLAWCLQSSDPGASTPQAAAVAQHSSLCGKQSSCLVPPTNLINFPSRPSSSAAVSPQLRSPLYFE